MRQRIRLIALKTAAIGYGPFPVRMRAADPPATLEIKGQTLPVARKPAH
jgi:hypothetical protein